MITYRFLSTVLGGWRKVSDWVIKSVRFRWKNDNALHWCSQICNLWPLIHWRIPFFMFRNIEVGATCQYLAQLLHSYVLLLVCKGPFSSLVWKLLCLVLVSWLFLVCSDFSHHWYVVCNNLEVFCRDNDWIIENSKTYSPHLSAQAQSIWF